MTEKIIVIIENFLKIKLTEMVEAVEVNTSKSSGESLTMGDLIKQAMEKE